MIRIRSYDDKYGTPWGALVRSSISSLRARRPHRSGSARRSAQAPRRPHDFPAPKAVTGVTHARPEVARGRSARVAHGQGALGARAHSARAFLRRQGG